MITVGRAGTGRAGTGIVVTVMAGLALAGCSSSGSAGAATGPQSSSGSSTTPQRQAVLELRPVLVERAPGLLGRTPSPSVPARSAAEPSARPSDASDPAWITPEVLAALDRLECGGSTPVTTGDAALPRTACATGSEAYLLGPVELTGADVAGAAAEPDVTSATSPGPRWTVRLTLTDAGRTKLAAMTQRLCGLPAPRNQLGIMVDGVVLAAPRVAEPIQGGIVSIAGDYDQARASDLARRLNA
jgi:preprotein translocase subunit SecD